MNSKETLHPLFASLLLLASACGAAPDGTSEQADALAAYPARRARPTITRMLGPWLSSATPATPPAPWHRACPTDRSCRVMPLGDSITYGYGSTDGAGYRSPLFHLLLQDGHQVIFVGGGMPAIGPAEVDGQPFPVAHEGHVGFQSFELAAILDASLATYQPDVVFLMIGTNDVANGHAAEAPANIAALVDQVHRDMPLATVLLSTVIPRSDPTVTALGQPINAEIPNIVAMRSEYCREVDSFAAFVAEPGYQSKLLLDGAHPNDAGYDAMAAAWATVLESVW